MSRAWRDCGANPASQHSLGRQARRMLEEAREGILDLLGAKTGGMDADQLIFTSGGTEANNLALLGLASFSTSGTASGPGNEQRNPTRVAFSPLEHPSVTVAIAELGRRGALFGNCRVTTEGVVDLVPWHEAPGS